MIKPIKMLEYLYLLIDQKIELTGPERRKVNDYIEKLKIELEKEKGKPKKKKKMNYTDTQLLDHLADCSPAQHGTINAAICIDEGRATIGIIDVAEGTSEALQDIIDDILDRDNSVIESLGTSSRTGGLGTVIDVLPS